MKPVISAEQMREIDRLTVQNSETTSLQLMQAAAHACFQAINSHFAGELAGKKAQILCGPGNNGGDGAALAQELAQAGVHADVVLFGNFEDTRGDARTNFEIVRQLSSAKAGSADHPSLGFVECDGVSAWQKVAQQERDYHIIVDALFGTGLSRPLQGVFAEVVKHLKTSRKPRASYSDPLLVSIDIPSGLNADSAKPIGPSLHADVTVTFTAPKPANVLPPASHLNGKLVVADIGSPSALVDDAGSSLFVIEENDARRWLKATRYTPDSFKNSHGHVLVIAGSRGYTGAAVLCGNAAMRSGTGLVTIATPVSAQSSVAASVMSEVMTTALAETDRGAVSDEAIEHARHLASKANVIAIGPGLSSSDERTRRFVYEVVKQRGTPVVIDADGLNCLAPWPADLQGSDQFPLIVTPHPGEMLRLLGTTDKSALDDRVATAREFATRHKLILVLKGSRSLIAAPDGRVFINPTGNAGLGTAGAGDTLTGIIAGFIAQSAAGSFDKADALFSVIAALYVGGLAGDFAARDLGMRAMVASDIREHLSKAFLTLDPEGEIP
ncbi:MAG: NAD(P)H-hydrate dehydratase [Pyrinomonadaceae bacterium]|nr:NAD(P)H-hydrate dehydratase [Pyrinomonadaceae bacterium]